MSSSQSVPDEGRHPHEFGVFALVFLGIGLLSMVAFNSPVLLLLKESAVTGLFGLVLLISLLLPRPMVLSSLHCLRHHV